MPLGALAPNYGGIESPPSQTQSAGTAIVVPIIPFGGQMATGIIAKGYTHVSLVRYTTAATVHNLFLMRPFNYTTFSAVAAAGQAVVNIKFDPGLYATAANWSYRPFPGGTPSVANHGIAANDYVMYQNADGTWTLDTVASVSTLQITMTTNLVTGGVAQGGLFYYFGVSTLKDPNTGLVNPNHNIAASQTSDSTWQDTTSGIVASLHQGDPMFLFSANGTNAGTFEYLTGWYGQL